MCVRVRVVGAYAHACGRGRSPVLFPSFGSNVQRILAFEAFAFCHGSSFKRLVLAAIALLRMVPMAIGL